VKLGRRPRDGVRQDEADNDDDSAGFDSRTAGPGIALIAPGDGLAALDLSLHRLELAEVLSSRQRCGVRLEARHLRTAVRDRIETWVGRTVVASV
jgi:hypothetical protein